MLTQLFPFLDPAHITPDLARRLRALADDCDRLEFGRPVSPLLLQASPLLEGWVPAMTPEGVQLVGHASGHPIHGDRMVMTTALWWADPDGTWVRTLSRFYRLGRPAAPDDARRILTPFATSSGDGDDSGSEDEA
ncbi:DUF6634 family protein [Bradyrhizobium sp. Ash2021]|uniref:DUF6634 family protein n=1 Tax=Bradyrhizobium sp. Ash2021 TaxID=2954771 RepID=UPI0028156CBD|nr:DUF6634 family protein [Bradyrhizobium sp. Ash2021]WMT73347.1 hypothetical protein NL528_36125 [Bradyrhizobium sp. Ash2021]